MLKRSLSGAVCTMTKATPASPRCSPTFGPALGPTTPVIGERITASATCWRARARDVCGRLPPGLGLLAGGLGAVERGLRDRLVGEQPLLAVDLAAGVVLGGLGAGEVGLGPLHVEPQVVRLHGEQGLALATRCPAST